MMNSKLTLVYCLQGENLGILTTLTPTPAVAPDTPAPVAIYYDAIYLILCLSVLRA